MEESVNENHLITYLKEQFNLPETDIRMYSPLTLAFIGDGIYDLLIRTMIVEQGNAPVNRLHKRVSSLVKAPTQMRLMLLLEPLLREDERGVYKRGRNAKSYTVAQNASVTEYRVATGFEALCGYLYLTDQMDRLLELIKTGLEKLAAEPQC
ncbi:Mini-ribonuclease 3 [Anaerolentibacter hominis]|uniref:Mini-ribonuclease 3 n=1 Tax=Anaerolentibacter hominis TaxID=3079009 RepID=UPI0031B88679